MIATIEYRRPRIAGGLMQCPRAGCGGQMLADYPDIAMKCLLCGRSIENERVREVPWKSVEKWKHKR